MLVSPAERGELANLGPSSPVPEQYGADFLMWSPTFGRVGVQRKEIKDLIASLSDGRVARELIQLKGLDVGIWLIEGNLRFTPDGMLMVGSPSRVTKAQLLGLTFSLSSQGFWVLWTNSVTETCEVLSHLEKWLNKPKHSEMKGREKARGAFGKPDLREQRIHFLTGLPTIGWDRASAILDHFGTLPLTLSKPLTGITGIGPKTTQTIEDFFNADLRDTDHE